MKKNVLIFGSIAGLILLIVLLTSTIACYSSDNYNGNMWLGYGSMLVAFSLIFVGIKNVRDKVNNGFITFGGAFKVGILIALIASTVYVVTWLFEYYLIMPDFMDKYIAHVLREAAKNGATAADLKAKKDDMAGYIDMYKTPFGVIVMTYLEVLPIGLIIAAIAALILKRKPQIAA
ncbi:DUF4199 domain-containing protein [Mucilaginibacter auburnensis]|uniref:Uncharacterized protein DUF4199 n=1 Tax=Mucilaginibacter auburnensis TaxID=1457233 RepID=A0A2H9VLQ1_9SPHI|nr:DUF4199 domain-containing protein [Mucilaginibacter auburnensis]PJJ79225.1 uncharacterized protein DUF4199 [Mucilaginibacter auburnensis]